MFIYFLILFNCVYVTCNGPYITVDKESFLINSAGYTLKRSLVRYFEHYFHFLIKRQFFIQREALEIFFYRVVWDVRSNTNPSVRVVEPPSYIAQKWHTSNLGTILFKITTKTWRINTMKRKKKKFVVYLWNKGSLLATGADLDPHNLAVFTLNGCSVNNCLFTRQHRFLNTADVILVNVHKSGIPVVDRRNSTQKWVLYSTESPVNMCKGSCTKHTVKLTDLADKFNWTMTYRSDSDVPLPYGRVIPLNSPVIVPYKNADKALLELVPHWKEKRHDILSTILMTTHHVNHQMYFLNRLMKYMLVDVYGANSTLEHFKKQCPYNINRDCPYTCQYLFYLVIENSRCEQYVTEKVFHNAFSKGAIPVILWGTPVKDCEELLPPHSYLHFDHYKSYKQLATHMLRISESKMELLSYHTWRRHFKIVNEHEFFGTKPVHFCRLCEALNYNDDGRKVYNFTNLNEMFGRIKCNI